MMTVQEWVAQFHAGAAALPGWKLQEGRLRRWDPWTLPGWACPLMAQWTYERPVALLQNSHPTILKQVWGDILLPSDADDLMDAADNDALGTHRLAPLRAQLLAACGVEEDGDGLL